MKSLTHIAAASALAIGAMTVGPAAVAQSSVTFFDKPPSAAELRRALMAPKARPAAPRPKTRGIVWNKAAPAALPANQAAQPAYGAAASAARPVDSTQAMAGPAAGMPINFSRGSAKLAPASRGFVRSVVEVLRSDPNVRLVIEGHTDATGGYSRNMVLSWERAMGVYRVLVEDFGIEPTRLQPVGKGPAEPMPGIAPHDGKNRRVQFRLNG